jgi:hypothetical protein
MAQAPDTDSAQGWVLVPLETAAAAGDTISVVSADGQTLAEYTAVAETATLVASTDQVVAGETYTVLVNGEETAEITAGEAAAGGTGGGGFPGGGFPGGGADGRTPGQMPEGFSGEPPEGFPGEPGQAPGGGAPSEEGSSDGSSADTTDGSTSDPTTSDDDTEADAPVA